MLHFSYNKFPLTSFTLIIDWWLMQRNRGKQQNGKDERSLQENQRYQGNISCKDRNNKGQKLYGPNRSIRYQEELARIHRKTVQKRSS